MFGGYGTGDEYYDYRNRRYQSAIPRSVSVADVSTEPMTLAEAKKHLEIAEADDTHDAEVSSLISAARELWEHDTQTLTTRRTVTENLPNWPDECWRFHNRPVTSITSIQYYDAANSQQTLSTDIYQLDAPNRRLLLKVDQDWPSIENRWDAITVTYVAGELTVSEIAKSAMKLKIDELFELRGMTKDKNSVQRAYEMLLQRFCRSSYP